MFALLIYLANLSGNLLFVTKFVMTGILALFALNILQRFPDYMVREGEGESNIKSNYKPMAIALAIALSFHSVIPSKETVYLMAGAYYGENWATQLSQSPEAAEIKDLVMGKLREQLSPTPDQPQPAETDQPRQKRTETSITPP